MDNNEICNKCHRKIEGGYCNCFVETHRGCTRKMKSKIHVGCSPLTGTIFAGKILKDGRTWASGKQDVTIESLVAVAQHVIRFGKPVEISKSDETGIEYRITVEKLA